MLWHERNTLIFKINRSYAYNRILVLIELSTCKAIAKTVCQFIVQRNTTECCLQATRMTTTSIRHHTSETIVTSHHRELLITNLHIISGEVKVKLVVQEIKMRSHLIVPARFWLILNRLCNTLIVSLIVCNIHISTCLISCL